MKLDTDIQAFHVEPLAYYLLKNLIPFTSIYPQNTLNQIAILLRNSFAAVTFSDSQGMLWKARIQQQTIYKL